jgi:hypothetical protein
VGADGPVVGIAGGRGEVCEECHVDGELWEERCWDGREAGVFEGAVGCVSCMPVSIESMVSCLVRA